MVRGQIVYVDFGEMNGGYIHGGYRPAVIVQSNLGNKHSAATVVVPLTTKEKKDLPMHVFIRARDLLMADSTALCEEVQAVNKSDVGETVGFCNEQEMLMIEDAQCVTLGIKRGG